MDLTAPLPDAPPPLGAYLDEWLHLQTTQLQPSTWASYRGILQRYVEPHLGTEPLDRLHPLQFTKLYGHLLRAGGRDGRPLSLRTIRYVHGILHKALEDARRAGYVAANPTDDATLPRVDPRAGGRGQPRLRTWTADELRRFLAATADTLRGPLWAVAAGTGLRRGELLGLRWDDVDLDGSILQVRLALSQVGRHARLKEPKTGRARRLRFDAHVAEALRSEQERQAAAARRLGPGFANDWNLVFTTDGGTPRHPDVVSRDFRRACRDAGVPVIRLHGLRHTHATLLLEAGVPVKVVSERLGHATVNLTLDIYAHVLPTMDADAVARFAAHVHRPPDAAEPAPPR